MEFKLELVLVPVTDVDRAKSFYVEQAGFNLEVDTPVGENMRVVQVTPPGSACSVGFGVGITAAPPGTAQGLHLVVSDIVAAAGPAARLLALARDQPPSRAADPGWFTSCSTHRLPSGSANSANDS